MSRKQTSIGVPAIMMWATAVVVVAVTGLPSSGWADVVLLANGERIEGAITSIVDDVITVGEQQVSLAGVLAIETGIHAVNREAAVHVHLAQGGNLLAQSIVFDGSSFTVQSDWGRLALNPQSIRAIWMKSGAPSVRFQQAESNRSDEQDQLIVDTPRGQQVVRGLVESITLERVMINYQGESRPVSIDKVAGLVTADLGGTLGEGLTVRCRLVDGGSVTGVMQGMENGKFTLALAGNSIVALPREQVASLSVSSDSVQWLSDLEPVDQEAVPLVLLPFQPRRDASVAGQPLALVWRSTGERREFSKGLGTRTDSRIVFQNNGFDRLIATVGIAPETEGSGACDVFVRGDGIELWSGQINGGGDPLEIGIAITGMDRVSLVTRHGANLDLGDHVNWANARLIRTGE